MASFRLFLSAASLFITVVSWPQAGGAAKSCAENMNDIYKKVASLEVVASLATDKAVKARASGNLQEYLKDTLPAFKAVCPGEANSIKDLENGNYLKKLAAEREKRNKAYRHVKASAKDPFPSGAGQDEDLEDLEVQR